MHTITREELKARIDGRQPLIVIEALEEDEYQRAHIPGAIRMTAEDAAKDTLTRLPDKTARIVVYCSGGECGDSKALAAELRSKGYADVTVYEGGKGDWMEAEYSTVNAVVPTPERRK